MDIFPNPRPIGAGLDGEIIALNSCVAVKIPRKLNESCGFNKEQENIYFLLGGSNRYGRPHPTPYLIPYLYLAPQKAIFMMRAKYDLRTVLMREYVLDIDRTTRWMGQLCAGVAFLERKGMVHGDLRPDNALVDYDDNIRINDFGYTTMPIGKEHFGISEPFGRQLGPAEGVDVDAYKYGIAGPRTENFALGSIYYCLLRGYYPYAKEEYDGKTLMRMFSLKQFPELGAFPEQDQIISRCWENYYKSVAELEQVFRDMKDGTEWYYFEPEDEAWLADQRRICEDYVAAGGIEALRDYREKQKEGFRLIQARREVREEAKKKAKQETKQDEK